MNLKGLMEKRNALLEEKRALLELVVAEERAFSEEEVSNKERLDSEIRNLENTIEIIKNEKYEDATVVEEIKEDKKMAVRDREELDNVQLRNVMTGKPVMRGISEEERAESDFNPIKTSDEEGSCLLPESIAQGIVETMEETCGIFAKVEKLPSVKGKLNILVDEEGNQNIASFVEEGEDATDFLKIKFTTINLEEKRFVAMYRLSQQMINNSAIDIVAYCLKQLAVAHARKIEKDIFTGDGEEGLSGLDACDKIEGVTSAYKDVILADDLNKLNNALFPEFLDGAVFYMHPDTYRQVALLPVETGRAEYLVQNGIINGKLTKTLYGFPIVRSVHMSKENPIYFGRIEDCYIVMIKKAMELKHIAGDTVQAVAGTHLLLLDVYMDGAVKNPQAMVRLENGTAEAPDGVKEVRINGVVNTKEQA